MWVRGRCGLRLAGAVMLLGCRLPVMAYRRSAPAVDLPLGTFVTQPNQARTILQRVIQECAESDAVCAACNYQIRAYNRNSHAGIAPYGDSRLFHIRCFLQKHGETGKSSIAAFIEHCYRAQLIAARRARPTGFEHPPHAQAPALASADNILCTDAPAQLCRAVIVDERIHALPYAVLTKTVEQVCMYFKQPWGEGGTETTADTLQKVYPELSRSSALWLAGLPRPKFEISTSFSISVKSNRDNREKLAVDSTAVLATGDADGPVVLLKSSSESKKSVLYIDPGMLCPEPIVTAILNSLVKLPTEAAWNGEIHIASNAFDAIPALCADVATGILNHLHQTAANSGSESLSGTYASAVSTGSANPELPLLRVIAKALLFILAGKIIMPVYATRLFWAACHSEEMAAHAGRLRTVISAEALLAAIKEAPQETLRGCAAYAGTHISLSSLELLRVVAALADRGASLKFSSPLVQRCLSDDLGHLRAAILYRLEEMLPAPLPACTEAINALLYSTRSPRMRAGRGFATGNDRTARNQRVNGTIIAGILEERASRLSLHSAAHSNTPSLN